MITDSRPSFRPAASFPVFATLLCTALALAATESLHGSDPIASLQHQLNKRALTIQSIQQNEELRQAHFAERENRAKLKQRVRNFERQQRDQAISNRLQDSAVVRDGLGGVRWPEAIRDNQAFDQERRLIDGYFAYGQSTNWGLGSSNLDHVRSACARMKEVLAHQARERRLSPMLATHAMKVVDQVAFEAAYGKSPSDFAVASSLARQ